jgi:hypothetical protein
MEDSDELSASSSSDDEPTNYQHSNILKSNKSTKLADYHKFYVHCRSKKKPLEGKKYISVDQIKIDAFALFEDGKFNDDNAILTHLNEKKVEVLLDSVPCLLKKRHSKHLFIRFVCVLFLFIQSHLKY